MSVKSKLTAIADAIRAKSGGTDALTLDGMAAAIAALATGGGSPTGGGLPTGVSALATGTFTPTSNITSVYTVTHDLGVEPNFAFLMLCDDAGTNELTGIRVFHAQFYKNVINYNNEYFHMRGFMIAMTSGGGFSESFVKPTSDIQGASTSSTVKFTNHTTYVLKAGYTYRWVCGVADGIL